MSFVSASFAALYVVAIALRWTAGRSGRSTGYLLALYGLSLVFYGWHVPSYLVLILVSTATDYVAARAMEGIAERPRARRAWLLGSLAVNLGLLGSFKYAGLLAETAGSLVALMGFDADTPAVEIVLPIGLSFYTFQSMSYTIDVYRGRLPAERSFWRLGLYVAFFPQLVAGPIVRAGDFLYQLSRPRRPRARVFWVGGYLILRGLFLKMVVADNLGAIVDERWADAAAPDAAPLLAVCMLVFFSCQLFCDFAGYSDIARGLAYQLGFRLPVNFDAPYIATSFREFWRRWHITLSQWMRDYVYIPLGGNRRGPRRALVNLLLVMAVSGLWHGANVTFVLWGVLHGVAAAVERGFGIARDGRAPSHLRSLLWFAVVQIVWILSMALFRAENTAQAGAILGNALSGVGVAGAESDGWAQVVTGWWFTLPVWGLHLRVLLGEKLGVGEAGVLERAIYAGAMLFALLTLYATPRGFIYFQF